MQRLPEGNALPVAGIRLMLGVLLVLVGVGASIWLFTIFYRVLFSPGDVPLVQHLLDAAAGDQGFEAIDDREGWRVHGGGGLLALLVFAVFCFMAIGRVIGALITGGAGLLGAPPRRKPPTDASADR